MAEPIDYSALAAKARGSSAPPPVDYSAMAAKARSGEQPQEGSVLGGMWDAAKGIVSGTASMGWHTLQSLMGDDTALRKDAENAVNAQADQWRKAQEALKRGDRVEAAGHLGGALLPIIGPAAAHAGERIGGEMEYGDPQHPERVTGVVRPPDVRGGIGEGLVIAGAPLAAEAAAKAAPAVARGAEVTGTAAMGAAKGAVQAATEMVPLKKLGVDVSLPKPLVSGAATATAFRAVGLPHEVGAVVGAGVPIVKGAITGARAALAERVAAAAAKAREATAPADASFVRGVPGEYPAQEAPALAPVRGLLNPGPNVIPVGAAAAPALEFLDQLAQSLGGKPFAKLNPAQQQQVRQIADRVSAAPQQAPAATPVPAPVRTPEPQAEAAIPAAPPEPPAPRIQPNMTRAEVDALPAPVTETDPATDARSPYLANGEKKSPQLRGQEKKAYNIDQKGQRFAQILNGLGITAKKANNIPLGHVPMEEIAKGAVPGWGNITDDLISKGLLDSDEVLPNESVPSIIRYLKQHEAAAKQQPVTEAPPAPEKPTANMPADPENSNGWKNGRYFVEQIPSPNPDQAGGYTINQLRDGRYQPASSSTKANTTHSSYSFSTLKEARAQVAKWNTDYLDKASGVTAAKAEFASKMEPAVNKLVETYRTQGRDVAKSEFAALADDLGTSQVADLMRQFQDALKANGVEVKAQPKPAAVSKRKNGTAK